MLNIEWWFFVQLANFLLLLVLLNYILFRPVLNIFKERDDQTKGSLDSAKTMDSERESLSGRIDSRLAETKDSAKKIFEELSKEGLAIQKQSMESATNQAVEINRKAREDLEADAKNVRDSLRKEVEGFSKKIVEKMVSA